MAHPTTDVPTNDRAVLASRLARDLEEVESVSNPTVKRDGKIVTFTVDTKNAKADLMRVLADHNANLSGICLEAWLTGQEAKAHVPRP